MKQLGTSVLTEIKFELCSYNDYSRIKLQIHEYDLEIKTIKNYLAMYAAMKPEDILKGDNGINTLFELQQEITNKLDSLEKCILEKNKLQILIDNFNLRQGALACNPNAKENIKEWLISNNVLDNNDIVTTNDTKDIIKNDYNINFKDDRQ